jgi:hypothetical protein
MLADLIGDYAFYSCLGLISVTIPNSVNTIGKSVFAGCTNLTNVPIGNRVTNIGDNAFYSCSSLKEIYLKGNAPSVGSENGVTSFGDCWKHAGLVWFNQFLFKGPG